VGRSAFSRLELELWGEGCDVFEEADAEGFGVLPLRRVAADGGAIRGEFWASKLELCQ
jgi:hypothetical protein